MGENGKQRIGADGKPAVRWGASQYRVILSPPRGVATKSPTLPTKSDQGSHENVAIDQEHSDQEHLINTSPHTSQAKVLGEDHEEILKALKGRSLPRSLPCDELTFVRFMQQMVRDCFKDGHRSDALQQITQTSYNKVKGTCKELAVWLVSHDRPVDPAYPTRFASITATV